MLYVDGFDFQAHKYGHFLCLNTLYLQKDGINTWWEGQEASKYNLNYYTLHQIICSMTNFMINDFDVWERYHGSRNVLIKGIMDCIDLDKKYGNSKKFLFNLRKMVIKVGIKTNTLNNNTIANIFDMANLIVPIFERPEATEIFIPIRLKRNWILSFFDNENEDGIYKGKDPLPGIISIEKVKRDLAKEIKKCKDEKKAKSKRLTLKRVIWP